MMRISECDFGYLTAAIINIAPDDPVGERVIQRIMESRMWVDIDNQEEQKLIKRVLARYVDHLVRKVTTNDDRVVLNLYEEAPDVVHYDLYLIRELLKEVADDYTLRGGEI